MTYFVTGATGFIGRNLVERLLERDGDVYVLVREGSLDRLDRLIERWEAGGPHPPVLGDLDAPRLGVSEEQVAELEAASTTSSTSPRSTT
jgi:thioester reductase-like protein